MQTRPNVSGRKRSAQPESAAAPRAEEHLYLQVARTLKEEIVSGIYPVGSPLPTEDVLRARFAVSRYTIREALRRLREDNLVSTRQGAATIVAPVRGDEAAARDVMSINDLLAFANAARFKIESVKMTAIDDKLAARTSLPVGEEWLAVRGVRQETSANLPASWTEYYIRRDFAAVGRLLERHTGPIFPLIEDLFGQTVVEVVQEISAALISSATAEALKAKSGTAALEVRRTYKTADGQIAQVTINTHPASRFRHSMTMRRVRGNDPI